MNHIYPLLFIRLNCELSAEGGDFHVLISTVTLIKCGSLQIDCTHHCHRYRHPTQLQTNAMFTTSRDNWQTICESHINLSNNLIIYLKRNWALWCSRTFNSALVGLSQIHTHTHSHSLRHKYKHSCAQRSVHSKSNRSHKRIKLKLSNEYDKIFTANAWSDLVNEMRPTITSQCWH